MAILVELTACPDGMRRVLLDERSEHRPGRYEDVMGAGFYSATVLVAVYRPRAGFVRQMFFDVWAALHGGTWREAVPGVWLHEPRTAY